MGRGNELCMTLILCNLPIAGAYKVFFREFWRYLVFLGISASYRINPIINERTMNENILFNSINLLHSI